MSVPTRSQLEDSIEKEQENINRLEKARDHFLAQWAILEKEQTEVIDSVRQYMEKIKMRDVLENIHSIKE